MSVSPAILSPKLGWSSSPPHHVPGARLAVAVAEPDGTANLLGKLWHTVATFWRRYTGARKHAGDCLEGNRCAAVATRIVAGVPVRSPVSIRHTATSLVAVWRSRIYRWATLTPWWRMRNLAFFLCWCGLWRCGLFGREIARECILEVGTVVALRRISGAQTDGLGSDAKRLQQACQPACRQGLAVAPLGPRAIGHRVQSGKQCLGRSVGLPAKDAP